MERWRASEERLYEFAKKKGLTIANSSSMRENSHGVGGKPPT